MKKLFVFLGIALSAIGSAASAQEVESMVPMQKSSWGDAKTSEIATYIPDVSLDMRGGFNYGNNDGAGLFMGDGLYLDINGYISPHFSYSINHRLASTYYEDNSGFNGTNWLTLTFEAGDFALTAGKDALLVGSFEYDVYDLDTYYDMNSTFYNEFDCWQRGVSGAWYPAEDQEVLLQLANSPFSYGEPDLFALAAGWRGAWDCYESYWTANLWQYGPKDFVKSVNLGNRFHFGNFSVDLDLMGRFSEMEAPFSGFTVAFAPSYEISDWGRIFAKGVWEDDNLIYGAGFEYFPLKENKDIRLHAAWAYNEYMYGNTLNIGLTWKMNMTRGIKRIFGATED